MTRFNVLTRHVGICWISISVRALPGLYNELPKQIWVPGRIPFTIPFAIDCIIVILFVVHRNRCTWVLISLRDSNRFGLYVGYLLCCSNCLLYWSLVSRGIPGLHSTPVHTYVAGEAATGQLQLLSISHVVAASRLDIA